MRRRPAGSLNLALLAVLIAADWAALTGCPPQPVVPPPDASDALAPPPVPVGDSSPQPAPSGDCAAACAALSAAGCSLGAQPDCPTFLTRDLGSGKVANPATSKPLGCADVSAVHTKTDAQKLGFACP